MIEAGGLIKLHYHKNLDLLELFSEVSQVLYYRDKSLFWNLEISQLDHNHLIKKNDGLFVDGTFIDRFDYHDNELYFDDTIVSREYTDDQITEMVESLWVSDPFLTIGKLDLTYWFEAVYISDTVQTYENKSDSMMYVQINNPNNQTLEINCNYIINTHSNDVITKQLPAGMTIQIKEINGNPLNNITVKLV